MGEMAENAEIMRKLSGHFLRRKDLEKFDPKEGDKSQKD